MNNKILVITFVVLVFILGGYMYLSNPKIQDIDDGVACTMDAMMCPDGSYVGRVAPTCEFAPCPIPDGTMMEDGVITDEGNQ